MKKIIFTLALVLTIGLSAIAQDGFFRGGEDGGSRTGSGTMPLLPTEGVGASNSDATATAPLGSGLIVLTALGAGYAISRKNTRRGE